MSKIKKNKPIINPKGNGDISWPHNNKWPSEDSEPLKLNEPDKSYQDIINFLNGPSNKNPPEELKDTSVKEIRKLRRKNFTFCVPDEVPFCVSWYGTWALLDQVIDWCQENLFISFNNKKQKRSWMRLNFVENNKLDWESPHDEYKKIWAGTLETLIEFLLILEGSGAIREPHIQRWAANHFLYKVRGEQRGINIYSLRAMWSTIKNSESGEGKKLTAEQRKSLKSILKEIKLAR